MGKDVIPLDDEHEAIRAQLEKDRKADKTLDGNEPKCIPNGPVMSMAVPMSIATIHATAAELIMVVDKITRHIWYHPGGYYQELQAIRRRDGNMALHGREGTFKVTTTRTGTVLCQTLNGDTRSWCRTLTPRNVGIAGKNAWPTDSRKDFGSCPRRGSLSISGLSARSRQGHEGYRRRRRTVSLMERTAFADSEGNSHSR